MEVDVARIVTVEQMRAAEAAADASGYRYSEMMETAGRAVAEAVLARLEEPDRHKVVILAGSGNNGGDGLVCAHYLRNAGMAVAVYLTRTPPADDPKVSRLKERAVLVADADQDPEGIVLSRLLGSATVIIDALVGTGARLPLSARPAQVLGALHDRLSRPDARPMIVAVDCPSGMECDTGACDPLLVAADLTVTFAAWKRSFLAFPAHTSLGELVVADIGLGSFVSQQAPLMMSAASAAEILPIRPRDAHKGTFGRALVVAGSRAFVGAAALAGEAAYRVGAGLVELSTPAEVWPILAGLVPEAIGLPLPSDEGALDGRALGPLRDASSRATATLVGPGLGSSSGVHALLAGCLEAETGLAWAPGRVVIDAEGLRAVATVADWPRKLPASSVLTPHPGEFSALTGLSTREIQADRIGAVERAARTWGHVVLLKGAFTVMGSPDGALRVLPFAEPALARAGTGDVLSGLIVGLLAQGIAPFEAACAAGWLHGRAAELAVKRLGTATSVVARDVVAAMPAVLGELGR